MPRKNKEKEAGFSPAHIFGIVDVIEKKMVKVSLDETDIDLEMVFLDPKQFYKCAFTILPKI